MNSQPQLSFLSEFTFPDTLDCYVNHYQQIADASRLKISDQDYYDNNVLIRFYWLLRTFPVLYQIDFHVSQQIADEVCLLFEENANEEDIEAGSNTIRVEDQLRETIRIFNDTLTKHRINIELTQLTSLAHAHQQFVERIQDNKNLDAALSQDILDAMFSPVINDKISTMITKLEQRLKTSKPFLLEYENTQTKPTVSFTKSICHHLLIEQSIPPAGDFLLEEQIDAFVALLNLSESNLPPFWYTSLNKGLQTYLRYDIRELYRFAQFDLLETDKTFRMLINLKYSSLGHKMRLLPGIKFPYSYRQATYRQVGDVYQSLTKEVSSQTIANSSSAITYEDPSEYTDQEALTHDVALNVLQDAKSRAKAYIANLTSIFDENFTRKKPSVPLLLHITNLLQPTQADGFIRFFSSICARRDTNNNSSNTEVLEKAIHLVFEWFHQNRISETLTTVDGFSMIPLLGQSNIGVNGFRHSNQTLKSLVASQRETGGMIALLYFLQWEFHAYSEYIFLGENTEITANIRVSLIKISRLIMPFTLHDQLNNLEYPLDNELILLKEGVTSLKASCEALETNPALYAICQKAEATYWYLYYLSKKRYAGKKGSLLTKLWMLFDEKRYSTLVRHDTTINNELMAASFEDILKGICFSHASCKSGKDRTGYHWINKATLTLCYLDLDHYPNLNAADERVHFFQNFIRVMIEGHHTASVASRTAQVHGLKSFEEVCHPGLQEYIRNSVDPMPDMRLYAKTAGLTDFKIIGASRMLNNNRYNTYSIDTVHTQKASTSFSVDSSWENPLLLNDFLANQTYSLQPWLGERIVNPEGVASDNDKQMLATCRWIMSEINILHTTYLFWRLFSFAFLAIVMLLLALYVHHIPYHSLWPLHVDMAEIKMGLLISLIHWALTKSSFLRSPLSVAIKKYEAVHLSVVEPHDLDKKLAVAAYYFDLEVKERTSISNKRYLTPAFVRYSYYIGLVVATLGIEFLALVLIKKQIGDALPFLTNDIGVISLGIACLGSLIAQWRLYKELSTSYQAHLTGQTQNFYAACRAETEAERRSLRLAS